MNNDLINAMQKGSEKAVPLLKIMAHEKRLIILCCLMDQEMSVGALSERIDMKQATLSQHLSALRQQGYVTTRRDGQTIYYSLCNHAVERVIHLLHELFCEKE